LAKNNFLTFSFILEIVQASQSTRRRQQLWFYSLWTIAERGRWQKQFCLFWMWESLQVSKSF